MLKVWYFAKLTPPILVTLGAIKSENKIKGSYVKFVTIMVKAQWLGWGCDFVKVLNCVVLNNFFLKNAIFMVNHNIWNARESTYGGTISQKAIYLWLKLFLFSLR